MFCEKNIVNTPIISNMDQTDCGKNIFVSKWSSNHQFAFLCVWISFSFIWSYYLRMQHKRNNQQLWEWWQRGVEFLSKHSALTFCGVVWMCSSTIFSKKCRSAHTHTTVSLVGGMGGRTSPIVQQDLDYSRLLPYRDTQLGEQKASEKEHSYGLTVRLSLCQEMVGAGKKRGICFRLGVGW